MDNTEQNNECKNHTNGESMMAYISEFDNHGYVGNDFLKSLYSMPSEEFLPYDKYEVIKKVRRQGLIYHYKYDIERILHMSKNKNPIEYFLRSEDKADEEYIEAMKQVSSELYAPYDKNEMIQKVKDSNKPNA